VGLRTDAVQTVKPIEANSVILGCIIKMHLLRSSCYFNFCPFWIIFYTNLLNLQVDVKIPGLPLKVVMEAIQQGTGEQ